MVLSLQHHLSSEHSEFGQPAFPDVQPDNQGQASTHTHKNEEGKPYSLPYLIPQALVESCIGCVADANDGCYEHGPEIRPRQVYAPAHAHFLSGLFYFGFTSGIDSLDRRFFMPVDNIVDIFRC